jgi:hypothetical protein
MSSDPTGARSLAVGRWRNGRQAVCPESDERAAVRKRQTAVASGPSTEYTLFALVPNEGKSRIEDG